MDKCVYIHEKADTGQPFYVGKGGLSRAKSKYGRSQLWLRTVAKHGLRVRILRRDMPEPCAFSLEKAVIAAIGRENLYNLTGGGEGASGLRQSLISRHRKSIANKGTRPAQHTIDAAKKKNSKPIGTRCGLRFGSAVDAARFASPKNPKSGKVSISNCACGKAKHSYGYEWGYLDESGLPAFLYKSRMGQPKPHKWRSIDCSNGTTFPSLRHAVEWLQGEGVPKASAGALVRSAKSGGAAYGWLWSYV